MRTRPSDRPAGELDHLDGVEQLSDDQWRRLARLTAIAPDTQLSRLADGLRQVDKIIG